MADHSRMLRLARGVSGREEPELARHLEASRVLVGLDAAIPGVPLAAEILVSTLRRMPMIIALDPTGLPVSLIDRLVEVAGQIDPDRPLLVERISAPNVVLRLAATAPDGVLRALPVVHGYRLARSAAVMFSQARAASALGSAAVAAVLAGEVFKVVARVLPPGGRGHGALAFCPVTLSDRPEDGPHLNPDWRLVAMLLGLGAIGTGTARILSELPVEGALDLVDPERFAPENVGTYSLGGAREAREQPRKVDLVAEALRRFETNRWEERAAALPGLVDGRTLAWPPIVLSGLDSAAARREAQLLRADELIDGGTGGTMVGLHVTTGEGQPCMACLFPDAPSARTVEAIADVLGLPLQLVVRGTERLTEEHVRAASPEKREQLRPFIGREICGLAPALGLTGIGEGDYQPAVPFVSLTAATLVVGRLVADATGVAPEANFVQFDALGGPASLTAEVRRERPGCECVVRTDVIRRVRARRRQFVTS